MTVAPVAPDVDVSNSGVGSGHVTRLIYGRHLRVLLVEADPDAAAAFADAAEESVLDVRVEVAIGVDAAVTSLQRSMEPRRRRTPPDIIVSSLSVPHSHQLLTFLRDDSRFDLLRVVVLAAESDARLERRSFALGAAGHLVAPRRDYERVALVHALPDFMPRARAAHAHAHIHR
ncbi:MAG: hypothetical protein JJE52_04035 [Acidimicrobiia bacterium]|nr:hypothetical protein [Acidimicrobiia bacterium]